MSWYKHKLIIDRNIWRCGHNGKFAHPLGGLSTKLLDYDGMMCCLGQACATLEPKEKLLNFGTPGQILNAETYMTRKSLVIVGSYADTDFSINAMIINDSLSLSRTGRELALFMLGKEYGIFIQFTGSYRD